MAVCASGRRSDKQVHSGARCDRHMHCAPRTFVGLQRAAQTRRPFHLVESAFAEHSENPSSLNGWSHDFPPTHSRLCRSETQV